MRSGDAVRIGILGGAFNPPHVGHVELARQAVEQLRLDRLLIVPTGVAVHKEIEADPGADIRLALCHAAVERLDRIEVDAIEVERDGPSYMADTLELVCERDGASEIFLILGEDAARGLGSWHRPGRIASIAKVAWVERPDGDRDGDAVETVLGRLGFQAVPLAMTPVDVASSQVRSRIAAGLSIDGLVPEGVAKLIVERGLYLGGGGR